MANLQRAVATGFHDINQITIGLGSRFSNTRSERENEKIFFRLKAEVKFHFCNCSEFGPLTNVTAPNQNEKKDWKLLWIASHFFAFHLSLVNCPRRCYNWSAWCSAWNTVGVCGCLSCGLRRDRRSIFYEIIIIISEIRSERVRCKTSKRFV